MLHNDETALKKAKDIINKTGEDATIFHYFWIKAEDMKNDIFCYFAKSDNSDFAYLPGEHFPLFTRQDKMTDFIFYLAT